jgi:DnaJ-class molecular chaperone
VSRPVKSTAVRAYLRTDAHVRCRECLGLGVQLGGYLEQYGVDECDECGGEGVVEARHQP